MSDTVFVSPADLGSAARSMTPAFDDIALVLSEPMLGELGAFLVTVAPQLRNAKRLRVLLADSANRLQPGAVLSATGRVSAAKEKLQAERFADRKQVRERLVRLLEGVERGLALSRQTDAEETAIRSLLEQLSAPQTLIRAFLTESLPGDMILGFRQKQAASALFGGRCLLAPDLLPASALWTKTTDAALCETLGNRFEEWWNAATPCDEPLTKTLGASWATATTSPYLLYLSVLYRLVADRLGDDVAAPENTDWMDGLPPLADFQIVALGQALTILNTQRGVFISDVVGLGKTYIGTALLKRLTQQGRRATIFCPPALVPMWEEMNQMYGLAAAVFSTGRLGGSGAKELEQPIYQTIDRQIVLIDESHRFRNAGTRSYQALQEYTQTRSCVLLTATPYALRPSDVLNQIRLFADEETDFGLNPPRLKDFFRAVDAGKASLIDILRPLLIRRTRKHISRHYPDAAIRVRGADGVEIVRRLVFPVRETPEVVRYDVEGVFGGDGLYDYIVAKLGRPPLGTGSNPDAGKDAETSDIRAAFGFDIVEMTYARYNLFAYVRPAFQADARYRDLKRAGTAVRGFIRTLLFKRLESSVQAFRATAEKLLSVHDNFLIALKQGVVPAGEAMQRLLYDDALGGDEAAFVAALEQTGEKYAPEAFDLAALTRDVKSDSDVLAELAALLAPITPAQDGKLLALRSAITGELAAQKVLIFTQFEATAQYLAENLSDLPQVAWLSGRHRTGGSFMKTIARFAPVANPLFADPDAVPIRVLVATDVLSEGLNLQDCSVIINYDLHYNPVRLIQRVGRVDRIGSTASRIRLFNFLPERNVEKVLKLEEVLARRIADIHAFVGEDNAILHPDEQLNDADMYAAYTAAPNDNAETGENEASPVDVTEIEERLRFLQRTDPDLLARVRDLPPGVRTGRTSPAEVTAKAFVFLSTDTGYQELRLVDARGETLTSRLGEVLRAIECAESEPTLPVAPRQHNAAVSAALLRFEAEAGQRAADRHAPRLSPGQQFALRHLSLLIKSETDDDARTRLIQFERAMRSKLPEAAVRELNRLRRLALPLPMMRDRIALLYRDLDLGRFVDTDTSADVTPLARIVCSESLA